MTNTATATNGTVTSNQDTETVTAVQNAALTLVKTATPETYSAVDQVINYTIVATNDGNTTLNNVTVSDPSVSGLSCTPANGSSLAPGESMNCTAIAYGDAGGHRRRALR